MAYLDRVSADFLKNDLYVIFPRVSNKLFAHETLDYILQHIIQLRPRLCRLCEAARPTHTGEKAVIITANIIRRDSFLLLGADGLEQDANDAAGRRDGLAGRLALYRQFM